MGMRPSAKSIILGNRWSSRSRDRFVALVKGNTHMVSLYSILHGVMRIELLINSDKLDTSVRDILVEEGHAEKVEESFESKVKVKCCFLSYSCREWFWALLFCVFILQCTLQSLYCRIKIEVGCDCCAFLNFILSNLCSAKPRRADVAVQGYERRDTCVQHHQQLLEEPQDRRRGAHQEPAQALLQQLPALRQGQGTIQHTHSTFY